MLFAFWQKASFSFANGKHFIRRSRASRAKRASLRQSRNFIENAKRFPCGKAVLS
jgi:hypothetical protein